MDNTNFLVTHARRELALIEEEPDIVEYYIDTLLALVGLQGDPYTFFKGDFYTLLSLFVNGCDYSQTEVIETIASLMHFQTLSSLTDNPKEWVHHKDVVHNKGVGVWQNRRDPGAFSHDGGDTYNLLSEGHLTEQGAPLHTTKRHN